MESVRIQGVRLDSSGGIVVEAAGNPGTHLRLHRSETLGEAGAVVALALSPGDASGTARMLDAVPAPAGEAGVAEPGAQRFYRLVAVPLDSVDDTDADGPPDAFELRSRPLFDPLDPADGNLDPDGDGPGADQNWNDTPA